MANVDEIIKCSECSSRNLHLDTDKGELYCKDCGLVLDDEMMEVSSAGKEKTGDPLSPMTHSANREGFILGSLVGERNVDGSIDRSKIGRILRKTNSRNRKTSYERNLTKGIVLVGMLASEFEVGPQLREQIVWNYKRIHKERLLPGMSLEVRAAAIVYFTFKENGISRTIEEVCAKNSAHPRQVARSARKIATYFRKPWILSQKRIDAEVEKYCSKMQCAREFTTNAINLTIRMHEIGDAKYVTTNIGFTAACIYLAGRLTANTAPRTQVDICRICNITEVTLRNNLIVMLGMFNLTREEAYQMEFDEFMEGAYERAGWKE